METSENINTSNEEIFYTADTNNDQQLSQEEAQDKFSFLLEALQFARVQTG